MRPRELRSLSALIVACCLLVLLLSACFQIPGLGIVPGNEIVWQQHTWDGLDRVVGVYTPHELQSPAPLVFLLHGGGGSAAKTWNQEHARSWKTLSDTYGFVLALPQGVHDPGDESAHHWNDCRVGEQGSAIETSADDVGFITELIGVIGAEISVDPLRVYATGASNGGMMTFRLAMEAGGQFAAMAAIIANLPEPSECTAEAEPIPMLIMNGNEDPLIPFEGGCVVNALCNRGRVMSTADTVAYWIDANGASSDAVLDRLPNRAWFDDSRVIVYRFAGGADGEDVVYYHIQGGGHTVPGYERESAAYLAIAGPKNRDIDAPTEIWNFFLESSP